MKQSTKQQNTTSTTVKNPNWPEANQLAIYKCSWEVEPGTTRIKFNKWSERVLNPGSPDLKASALTTRPHWPSDSESQPVDSGSRIVVPDPESWTHWFHRNGSWIPYNRFRIPKPHIWWIPGSGFLHIGRVRILVASLIKLSVAFISCSDYNRLDLTTLT